MARAGLNFHVTSYKGYALMRDITTDQTGLMLPVVTSEMVHLELIQMFDSYESAVEVCSRLPVLPPQRPGHHPTPSTGEEGEDDDATDDAVS